MANDVKDIVSGTYTLKGISLEEEDGNAIGVVKDILLPPVSEEDVILDNVRNLDVFSNRVRVSVALEVRKAIKDEDLFYQMVVKNFRNDEEDIRKVIGGS